MTKVLFALLIAVLCEAPPAAQASWGDQESCRPSFQIPGAIIAGEIRKVLIFNSSENADKVLMMAPVGSNNIQSLAVGFEGQTGSLAQWKNGSFRLLLDYSKNSGYELYKAEQKVLVLDCN